MDFRTDTRAFALFLAVSLAAHAGVLAWWQVSRPVTEAQLAFKVEILPLQPVPGTAAPAIVAPPPPPARTQARAPSLPQPLPVQRVPEPPPSSATRPEPPAPPTAAAAPVESARGPDREAPAPAERRTEAAAAPATPASDAAYLRNALAYPAASIRNNEQGTVLVKVLVGRDGTVLKAELEKSSGWPHLDAAAMKSVRTWRFTPARRGEEAIEKEYLVPAVFRLENARR